MRLVLDPNVLVSAVVADGESRRLFDAWRVERRYELIVCPLLLAKLADVLSRDRLRRFITLDQRDVLMARCVQTPRPSPIQGPSNLSADPDDDYLVASPVVRLPTRSFPATPTSPDSSRLHAQSSRQRTRSDGSHEPG